MANARKLQAEVDRTLKKVDEGLVEFDDMYEKVLAADGQMQKTKYEEDLKKEIKKLQRYREQIKGWAGSAELKNKAPLLEARKKIETRMETFKVVERETKTKAYSKEGLMRDAPMSAEEKKRARTREWVQELVGKMGEQIDEYEAEIESLEAGGSKSKKDKDTAATLENVIKWHHVHIDKLEALTRLLDNAAVEADAVDAIKDDLEYYLEQVREDEYQPDFELYDQFDLLDDGAEGDEDVGAEDEDEDGGAGGGGGAGAAAAAAAAKSKAEAEKSKASTAAASAPAATAASASAQKGRSGSVGDGPKAGAAAPAAAAATSATTAAADGKGKTGAAAAGPSTAAAPAPAPAAKGADAKAGGKAAAAAPAAAPAPAPAAAPAAAAAKGGATAKTGAATTATTPIKTGPAAAVPAPVPVAAPAPRANAGESMAAIVRGKAAATATAAATGAAAASSAPAAAATSAGPSAAALASAASASSGAAAPSTTASAGAGSSAGAATSAPVQTAAQRLASSTAPAAPAATGASAGSAAPAAASLSVPGASAARGSAGVVGGSRAEPAPAPAAAAPVIPDAVLANPWTPLPVSQQRYNAAVLAQSLSHLPDQNDSERPKVAVARHPNPFPVPPSFPSVPTPALDNPALMAKLSPDTLFYAFYYQPGTLAQYRAAKELKRQSWRFNTKYSTWMLRDSEPTAVAEDYEKGTYVYFEYDQGWVQRIKSEFVFEYAHLENELT